MLGLLTVMEIGMMETQTCGALLSFRPQGEIFLLFGRVAH
jgi:hypothetical protein